MLTRALIAALALSVACSFDGSGLDFTGDGGGDGDAGSTGDGGDDGDAGSSTTSLRPGDMRLVFGEVASDKIRSRRWHRADLSWTDEPATEAVGGNPIWLVNQVTNGAEPTELVAAQIKRLGGHTIAAYAWDGRRWTREWQVDTALTQNNKRAFDLATDASGNALMVYASDSPTPTYRVRTDGVWSAAMPLPVNDGLGPKPDTNSGIIHWIELEARPGTDQIGLLYSDSNRDLVAMIWDGDHWLEKSAITLDTELKENNLTGDVANRAFDLAFESLTGDLLVAWGQENQDQLWYQHWDASEREWVANALRETGFFGGHPHYIDLAADPVTDRIAAGLFDLGDGTERLGVGIWTGDTWTDKDELDNQTRDVNDGAIGDMPGAVAWLAQAGVAVVVYADNQIGTLDWARWEQSRGWTLENDVAFADKGFTESVQIQVVDDDQRMLVLLSDHTLRLFATTYDGSSWQLSNDGAPLTSVLSNGDSMPFFLSVRK